VTGIIISTDLHPRLAGDLPATLNMKTIAVLIDFSPRANHAARYALQLARQLHANILLYHTFFVPAAEPLSAQIAWPMEDFEEIKTGSEKELQKLAGKLKKELTELPGGAFRPDVAYSCHEGAFALNLGGLTGNKELVLLVIANHHAGFSALITGNHLRGILDTVALPVLVVPEHSAFKKIEKIAFATDLGDHDLEVIQSLAGLARPFNAEIMLANIGTPEAGAEQAVKDFLDDVGNKIDYPNIYYRRLAEKQVSAGLSELEQHTRTDMLVMVHRNKGFIERLFGGSHTQKIAADPLVPLLIYPYRQVRSCPVF
jgi:nucleotide-binding universal stress UspA family protein